MPTIEEMYQALVENPRQFLGRHLVRCALPIAATGVRQAYFTCQGASDYDRANFLISHTAMKDWLTLEISVFYLTVTPYQAIATEPAYPCTSPPAAQAGMPQPGVRPFHLYVTPPLSGCTLVSKLSAPGGPLICHVQPEPGMGGVLQQTLRASSRRLAHVPDRPNFYGREDYRVSTSNIIGVGNGARWRFYDQRYNAQDVRATLRTKPFSPPGRSRIAGLIMQCA